MSLTRSLDQHLSWVNYLNYSPEPHSADFPPSHWCREHRQARVIKFVKRLPQVCSLVIAYSQKLRNDHSEWVPVCSKLYYVGHLGVVPMKGPDDGSVRYT